MNLNKKKDFYKSFFKIWKDICIKKEKDLLDNWGSKIEYTKQIFRKRDNIINDLASRLNLNVYCEYYFLDAVFYSNEDRLTFTPEHKSWNGKNVKQGTWLRHIQIVLEHENEIFGAKGGYQEICHLLTTNADYKVLVGYSFLEEQQNISRDMQEIMKGISSLEYILLILGDLVDDGKKIAWNGYILSKNEITYIKG